MQIPIADGEEHVPVRVHLRVLLLELDDVDDGGEFLFGAMQLGVGLFGAEVLEDAAGFVDAADFDEPAGGFGHPPEADLGGWVRRRRKVGASV